MSMITKKWFSKEFIKYLIQNVLKFLGCLVVITAITYFFIDKSIITNPTNKTIISICLVTMVYIISTIIVWFSNINKLK
jgi:ATP/ADP translocase